MPIPTSASKSASLRAGSIGSIRAWLPSRRSKLHQRGAVVSCLDGQVRSGSTSGTVAAYFSNGILEIVNGGRVIFGPFLRRGMKKPPGQKAQEVSANTGGVFA